jgi:orotidine-5'-phosphate decarboxylase
VQAAVGSTGATVAQSVIDAVAARNAGRRPGGDLGVVVGATAPLGAVRLDALNGPILAPGIGAQGAQLADLPQIFGAATRQVVATTSRDLLRHGPQPASLRHAARRMADQAGALLHPLTGQLGGGTPG